VATTLGQLERWAAHDGIAKLAPHDLPLRHTCARLGGELDQIPFPLGHVSIQTTERCKACKNCSSCKHCAKDGGTCGVSKKK